MNPSKSEKLVVYAVYASEVVPPFPPVADRVYRCERHWDVWVVTNCGVLHIHYMPGFESDGRSGPIIVDYLLPNNGVPAVFICWLFHDALFYSIGLSFETSNDVLEQMLELAGVSDFKAGLAEWAISAAGKDHFGEADTDWERENRKRFTFHWIDHVPRHAVLVSGEAA